MRRLADAERIDRLLRALGKEAREDTRLYLVGGPAIAPATFRRAAEEAFAKDTAR